MPETNQNGLLAGFDGARPTTRRRLLRATRGPLSWLTLGLLTGAWLAGGPDRFGEREGFMGNLRGALRTMGRGGRYAAATLKDCVSREPSSVKMLGLTQQVETRLWQDKRLAADGIVVEVSDETTVVLKGLVPDDDHKEKAVALAQYTRGVEKVVDELAVPPPSRTIEADPAEAVPTGVATGVRIMR